MTQRRSQESILKRNLTKSFKIGDFTIDKDNRTVLIDDYAIDFTKIEFEIFIYLIEIKIKYLQESRF